MKNTKSTSTVIHRILALFIALCLIMPGLAMAGGGKSGKKNYREGLRFEDLQQWDLAAQQFALAVAAEPNNAEYKLHYQRALQQASVMYLKRGDDLAAQNDFAAAYSAYRSAWSYDQGNEISKLKMERMLEQQKAQASGNDPGRINNAGNFRPTSNEVQVAAKPRSRDVVQTISFKEAKFKTVVTNLGRQLGLNVVFDESVKDTPINVDLTDVTVSRALDIVFKTYKYSFEQVDRRTILVYTDNPTNRPRFENLLVKTFYLGNINGNQARTVVQGMLPPGRVIQTLDQGQTQGGNLLVVKATQQELQLVNDLLGSLDKNKNEVMMDMEIYEVNNGVTTQIGQQITTSGNYTAGIPQFGLQNLGGFGFTSIQNGGLFGLPTTSLSLFQNKGNSKLLYKTQIHALDGQKNVTKVGQSVPVRVGSTGGYNNSIIGNQGNNNQGNNGLPFNSLATNGIVDNIQYRDVGLVIEAKPSITNEGYVEVEMKFETSNVAPSGGTTTDPLTPTFTTRSLNTTARMQDGVTAVVAGINQDQNSNTRSGVPVVGMVPLLGRLFSAPNQQNTQTDIIITVTPHIKRSQGINKDDYLARNAGSQQAGPGPSIEEVVNRAQQEDEQERRLIAQQLPTQTLPLTSTSAPAQTQVAAAPVTIYSNPSPRSTDNAQPIQSVGFSTNRNQSLVNGPAESTSAPRTPSAPVIEPQPPADIQPVPVEETPEEQPNGTQEQVNISANRQAPYTANPVMVQRPEGFDRAKAEAEAKRKVQADARAYSQTAATNTGRAPVTDQLTLPLVNASRSVAAASFSMSPRAIRQQAGKVLTIAVEVSSESLMTGANIALNFDPSKLKFKTVRDGGLLGSQPGYELEKGNLVIRVNQPKSASVKATGQLILVDFTALAEGQSEVTFSNGGNQLRLTDNTLVQANGSPAQVVITRDPAVSATNER